jgi:hypothetical protein
LAYKFWPESQYWITWTVSKRVGVIYPTSLEIQASQSLFKNTYTSPAEWGFKEDSVDPTLTTANAQGTLAKTGWSGFFC